MRARSSAQVNAAAAASLICAVTLQLVFVESARARDAAPATRTPDSAAALADPQTARNRWGADYFPDVALTTQHGKSVRFYSDLLKGKSVVINVIFTACTDVCPLETANLVRLRQVLGDKVGKDVFFYSISIDPTRDTPEVLKAYAEKFGAGGPGWLFLTGKPEDIKLIARKLALVRERDVPTSRESHHASYLMLGIERSGLWTRKHAADNPRFLAATMGTFFGWKATQPEKSYAEARPLAIDEGQRLFQSRCSACHTIGQGDKTGPDLAGVMARRERAWLARYIQAPDELLAAGDPVATALYHKYKQIGMPNLRLAPSEVAELLAYLETRQRAR
jgi:protein SCO1/2